MAKIVFYCLVTKLDASFFDTVMCITIFGLVLMQPVVSFWRVCFCLWYRFFLCALPGFSPYRRGGCSPDAKQSKEQQEETGQALFFLLPYGVTAEYQPFKIFSHNYFEIVDKIISL